MAFKLLKASSRQAQDSRQAPTVGLYQIFANGTMTGAYLVIQLPACGENKMRRGF